MSEQATIKNGTPSTSSNGSKKTLCPLTRERFKAKAQPIVAEIDGQKVILSPREFSTGSFGWYYNGVIILTVDGVPLKVQGGITLTVANSKTVE